MTKLKELQKGNLYITKRYVEATDLAGWKQIGNFGTHLLYSKDNLRLIIEPSTGKIVTQYKY